MADNNIRNLDFIRNVNQQNINELGPKLAEALLDLLQKVDNSAMQTNSNPNGDPQPPPGINGLKVTGKNGQFDIAIQDDNDIYRGINYYVEYADNPDFTNPRVIDMGTSRNETRFLGDTELYWRGYSAYPGSAPGEPVYFGGPSSPTKVKGGGQVGGPDFLPSQGSGTGAPGQGLMGPGKVAFRSPTGVPPIRKAER